MSKRTLQAVAIYLGAGWTGFGIVSWMVSRYGLNPKLEDTLLWLMLVLTPAVALLAAPSSWSDGRMIKRRRLALGVNLALALLVGILIYRTPRNEAPKLADQEAGGHEAPEERDLAERTAARVLPSLAVFTPGFDGEPWKARAFAMLLSTDLEQSAALTVYPQGSFATQIKAAGYPPLAPISEGLRRRLGVQENIGNLLSSELRQKEGAGETGLEATLILHPTTSETESELSCSGADLFELTDACTEAVFVELFPEDDSASEDPNLPVTEVTVGTEASLKELQLGIEAITEDLDYVAGAAHFRAALEEDPNSALLHYWLGSALQSAGDAEGGIEHLRLATRSDFRLTQRMRFQAAATYLTMTQQPDEALGALQNWATMFPDSVEAQLRLATVLESRSRPEEAANAYREVLRVQPTNIVAGARLSNLDRSAGRFEEALETVRKLRKDHPRNASLPMNESRLLMDLGRAEEAISVAQAAVSISNRPAAALRHLASMQFRAGHFEESAESLQRSLREDGDQTNRLAVLQMQLTQALVRGEVSKHREILEELSTLGPNPSNAALSTELRDSLVIAQLGSEEQKAGVVGRLPEFQQRIGALPESTQLSLLPALGLIQSSLDQADQALASFAEIERIGNNFGVESFLRYLPHWRGHVAEDSGDLAKAEALYKEAFEADPTNFELGMELGRVFRKAKRFDEARQVLEDTLQGYPAHPEGNLELALALEGLGKIDEARERVELAAEGFEAADGGFELADTTRTLRQRLSENS